MVPFLKQVAEHYYAAGHIEGKCFVFPNRRALTFFKKYLSEKVKVAGVPVFAPQLYSIDDFLFHASSLRQADRICLLLELYESYRSLNREAEPLDDFIFWGDVLLGDFDDVDKYLIDPAGIFTNIAQFKEMQKPEEYLTDNQLNAIREFIGHFENDGEIKREFRKIWDILYDLYVDFRSRLSDRGLSYQGMAYRSLADRFSSEAASDIISERFGACEKIVFVGLNALTECEKRIFSKLRDAGIAEFCWDYSSEWIKDADNKSSFFLSKYVETFPQAPSFVPDGGERLPNPRIDIISVPSSVGQAKLLPEILNRCGDDTAVVIPDEKLLIPVLNSIPESRQKLNVTMGYPVSASQMWALMDDVATLQMHIRMKAGKPFFYAGPVLSICSNPIVAASMDESDREVALEIRKSGKYYIPREDFERSELLKVIFNPVVSSYDSVSGEQIRDISCYQKFLVEFLAPKLKEIPEMSRELEFAREYYLALGKLERYSLSVRPGTYFRILRQLFAKASVPFAGEPVEGLQIMGPLETRCLDFENIIILSCNEGVFPRRSVSSSFIPPELRSGFELPTYEYQDAVWAYYFYRMVQRSSKVWMLVNSCSGGLDSGEESRYIKQLEMHYNADIRRFYASSPLKASPVGDSIEKTAEHINILRGYGLSPSVLGTYDFCQAKFYYERIEKLKPEEEASDLLEANDMGNVFHYAMEDLYKGRKIIERQYLCDLIRDRKLIAGIVREKMLEELRTIEISGRNIVMFDVICRYVMQTLQFDLSLLEKSGADSFEVIATEVPGKADIGGFHFSGRIDRIDSFSDGTLRVVDYKTGSFDRTKTEKFDRQLYIYDLFIEKDCAGKDVTDAVYHIPTILTDELYTVHVDNEWKGVMQEAVQETIDEICDLSKPFRRLSPGSRACEQCNFKTLCGR